MNEARRILASVCAALALLGGCTASRLVKQEKNPEYSGKPFGSVLVVAVHADELVRRPFEDRIVARLGARGRKGIPSYDVLGRGKVEEAALRRAIAQSGADGVLVTRISGVDRPSWTVPGATIGVSMGWGGFYGYYSGLWETVNVPSQQVSGSSTTYSETRLFDAKSGVLAWRGVMETRQSDDLDAVLTQYIDVIFNAMVSDRVL